ncbi:fibro-slime domain-containing protein [Atopobiaceae bacterium 24-176]
MFKRPASHPARVVVLAMVVFSMVLSLVPVPAQADVTQDQLASHVVTGLDPANTTVNLFNYHTGMTGTGVTAGTDTLGTTGAATPLQNYQTWLANNTGINYGHLLTFGDGMRHLGYWNQGIVESYGDVARTSAGMQGIVEPALSAAGYPVVSDSDEDGLDVNTATYSDLTGGNTWTPNQSFYGNAGPLYISNLRDTATNPLFHPVWGRNVDRVVQAQALAVAGGQPNVDFSALNNNANPSTQATKTALEASSVVDFTDDGGYDLPESVRSLQYLFDPNVAHGGKESYRNVTGLFQMDDQGYYYYNMRENFAEFVSNPTGDSAGHFTLYDAPAGLRTDGTNSVGNFFPFNSAEHAFSVDANGELVNALNANNQGNIEPVDHHLGMTVETGFRQPIDGMVGANPMTFEFAGDDDVWVFIDDVLVLDLGGIHSELFGTIDFSTGQVYMGPAFDTNGIPDDPAGAACKTTSIREAFEKAGHGEAVRWNGDTFASNTSHTLKMFYLERGNYDSSIALRFNLQPALYQQIYKVDQYGNPLEGAEFDLYAVRPKDGTVPTVANSSSFGLDDVEIQGSPLTHLVTDADGVARFEDPTARAATDQAEPFNFSDRYDADTGEGLLYILRETKAPAGYRSTPQDLLLRFEPQYTMLVVNNRYQTGAYASFISRVTGNNAEVYFGQIGEDGGLVTQIPGSDPVPVAEQADGLVVAVPMLRSATPAGEERWLPLYGDNLTGFKAVEYSEDRVGYEEFKRQARQVTLRGALMQMAAVHNAERDGTHASGWYFTWDAETQRLQALLENLPGRADRYLLQNPETGDMRNFYAIIKPDALARALGVSRETVAAMDSSERYAALGAKVAEALDADGTGSPDALDAIVDAIDPDPEDYLQRGYCSLDIRQFVRDFRSRIYIPNEQRELRVMKVDQTGTLRNGAVFALYGSRADAEANDPARALSQGTTATLDGTDGMLVFEPHEGHKAAEDHGGYGDMTWPDTRFDGEARTYYLREVSAPEGCELNPRIVEVQAGVYSIYADAGEADDGVTVMAGVGKLAQTMVKYASDGAVNITLRDITAFAQSQPSGSFAMDGWADTVLPGTDGQVRSLNLHYGINAVVDYGLSDEDGGKNYSPFFVTDTGYVRTRVQQNLHEHDDPDDPFYSTAEADYLGDMDITGLFSLINTVVVTDRDPALPATGSLVLSKTVEGDGLTPDDYLRNFNFKVLLHDADGNELTGSFHYYGRDRAGMVKSGDVLPLHHGEELVVLGLPEGTQATVTEHEANADGFYTYPASGTHDVVVEADGTHRADFVNVRGTRPAPPDLSIYKEQAVGEGDFTRETLDVGADDVVTYRVTVTNNGQGPARDVTVTDEVPEGLTYVEGSASDGGTWADGVVRWELGVLAAGESRTVSFQVTVPEVSEPTAWVNVASVIRTDDEGDPTDPLPSNEVVVKTPVDGEDPVLPNAGGPDKPDARLPETGGKDPRVIPVLGDPAFMVPLGLVAAALIGLLFTWMLFPKRS